MKTKLGNVNVYYIENTLYIWYFSISITDVERGRSRPRPRQNTADAPVYRSGTTVCEQSRTPPVYLTLTQYVPHSTTTNSQLATPPRATKPKQNYIHIHTNIIKLKSFFERANL